MSEDVSRRKMLSMLGLGAALGLTLSATLEPLEAEAQEAAPACTRCHRDSRDATTVSAAHYSPSAPAHTPHRSTCARRRTSSEAIAIRAGRAKQKGRGEHGFLVRKCSSVRETKVYGITASEKSPPSAGGWDSRRAVERLNSRSPANRLSYRLTTKSMRTAHKRRQFGLPSQNCNDCGH